MKQVPLFFLLSVLTIAGCRLKTVPDQAPVITVSILPQKYFVEKIAGNDFRVNVLIPPGASPDSYDPSPSQVRDLGRSVLFIRLGHLGFETTWDSRYRSTHPDLPVIDMDQGLDLITGDHDHQHGTGVDPHVWLSARMMKMALPRILVELEKINPHKAGEYTQNLHSLIQEMDSLDSLITAMLLPCQAKGFLIYHPALAYFARDYRLEQYSLEHEGKEPSAYDMKKLVDLARSEGIRLILIQKEFDMERALTLEKEIGGRVVQFDPLAENWPENMAGIAAMLKNQLEE